MPTTNPAFSHKVDRSPAADEPGRHDAAADPDSQTATEAAIQRCAEAVALRSGGELAAHEIADNALFRLAVIRARRWGEPPGSALLLEAGAEESVLREALAGHIITPRQFVDGAVAVANIPATAWQRAAGSKQPQRNPPRMRILKTRSTGIRILILLAAVYNIGHASVGIYARISSGGSFRIDPEVGALIAGITAGVILVALGFWFAERFHPRETKVCGLMVSDYPKLLAMTAYDPLLPQPRSVALRPRFAESMEVVMHLVMVVFAAIVLITIIVYIWHGGGTLVPSFGRIVVMSTILIAAGYGAYFAQAGDTSLVTYDATEREKLIDFVREVDAARLPPEGERTVLDRIDRFIP